MDQIFAPWRIKWVKQGSENEEINGCVFCELPKQNDDRDNLIVARSEHTFVLLNNYPYNPGHLMVIPHSHVATFDELSDVELLDHARMKARTIEALDTAVNPAGFNVGVNLGGKAAGGSIDDHLHTHVVPRWTGDANFMPVISDTKVIVEALEDTYEWVHEAFSEQAETNSTGLDTAVTIVDP
ncbi:HIT domain-containing protein [Salinarchaeum sp. IM2453]|uniref:HIT family protein n=1 Tax=Salinarchaeum sp. IM2453 TaxID=2862870 RepID=UPI001C8362A8|nr:HIT domain-containing protein [Salinarchaeum sp. IM2453]QZA89565.1 HIT domain-containing protein [Salinarchaeum sp. IM2453]